MNLKKTLTAGVTAALLLTTLVLPASAHGSRHHSTSVKYPKCTVEDCTRTYRHSHDGTTYCAHTADDGHTRCAPAVRSYKGGHHGGHC